MDTNEQIKEMVKQKYSEIALQDQDTNATSCCGSGSCSTEVYNIMNDDYDELKAMMANYQIAHKLVPNYRDRYSNDFNGFVLSVKDMEEDIEGFVVVIKDGETAKLKTNQYIQRHKSKGDVLDSPRKLFETVVNEEHDDLRGAFPDDEYLMNLIDDMEGRIKVIYKEIHNCTEGFYQEHKDLSMKDYAMLAQKSNLGFYKPLALNIKNGRDNDIKQFLLSHWTEFRDGTLLMDPKQRKAEKKAKFRATF